MPNHCSIEGCTTGYKATENRPKTEVLASFHYPFSKPELLKKWIKFTNRNDWHPTASSVICEKHFHEDAMNQGKKRVCLKWKLNPIPTKYGSPCGKRLLTEPNIESWRKPPKIRNVSPDQLSDFLSNDRIASFTDIGLKHCPLGFEISISEDSITFYKTTFDDRNLPTISQVINIDRDMHVKLQVNGILVPLPKWFVKGHNAKLTKLSMLENFPAYLTDVAEKTSSSILDELRNRQFYKSQGQPPYSPEILRYALLLRYTSPQCYRRLKDQFPLPSTSLLSKLHHGGPTSLQVAKRLLEAGEISSDVVLMADEMYIQESTQYHSGDFYGAHEEGNMYKGVVVFMLIGLKNSVPVVVRAVPEVSVNGKLILSYINYFTKIL